MTADSAQKMLNTFRQQPEAVAAIKAVNNARDVNNEILLFEVNCRILKNWKEW